MLIEWNEHRFHTYNVCRPRNNKRNRQKSKTKNLILHRNVANCSLDTQIFTQLIRKYTWFNRIHYRTIVLFHFFFSPVFFIIFRIFSVSSIVKMSLEIGSCFMLYVPRLVQLRFGLNCVENKNVIKEYNTSSV